LSRRPIPKPTRAWRLGLPGTCGRPVLEGALAHWSIETPLVDAVNLGQLQACTHEGVEPVASCKGFSMLIRGQFNSPGRGGCGKGNRRAVVASLRDRLANLAEHYERLRKTARGRLC
jgi:hypothetical protein